MSDRPIPGPYDFPSPPSDLCGWLQPESQREFAKFVVADDGPFLTYQEYLTHFKDDRGEPEETKIWEYAKRLLGGQHVPTWRQLIGDCVSFGCKNVWVYRQVSEIAREYQEETLRFPFAPYYYGMSRTAPDLGNGRLGTGDGSTGAWGAGAMRTGTLFDDDNNVPAYHATVAKDWGRGSGPPEWARELAKDNPVGKTAKLSSVEQVRHELINRRPVTMACMYDLEMQPREYRGHHVFKRGAVVGGHQIALIEWMDDPFPAAYLIGSWGANAHGTPLNGEPPGGAWVRAEDLEHHMRGGYSEFFAMSLLAGHPSEPNPSPL